MLDVRALTLPVIAAPMAGGPSSPALVAAVSRVGGLGMLAGGTISAASLAESMRETRERLADAGSPDSPFGVNLFVPREANAFEHELVDHEARASAVGAYAATVAAGEGIEAAELGTPDPDFDEDWNAKLDLLEAEPVALVTFTFGLPDPSVIERLHAAGSACGAMVTNADDAREAVEAGCDVVIAQGAEAGGHRSTWRVVDVPSDDDTLTVLASCQDAVGDRAALVAAGGIDGPERLRAALDAGAAAVQVGTALLLADEAGTKPTVRAALVDPALDDTIATRAFSGRVARAVRNAFAEHYDDSAPAAYPDVNQLTAPLRARAEETGDVQGVSAYAGVRRGSARSGRAEDLLAMLLGLGPRAD